MGVRLKHATEQLASCDDQAGDVYLSLLMYEGEEQEAVSVAQRFVGDDAIRNIRVIHADGTLETLRKKDAGLSS